MPTTINENPKSGDERVGDRFDALEAALNREVLSELSFRVRRGHDLIERYADRTKAPAFHTYLTIAASNGGAMVLNVTKSTSTQIELLIRTLDQLSGLPIGDQPSWMRPCKSSDASVIGRQMVPCTFRIPFFSDLAPALLEQPPLDTPWPLVICSSASGKIYADNAFLTALKTRVARGGELFRGGIGEIQGRPISSEAALEPKALVGLLSGKSAHIGPASWDLVLPICRNSATPTTAMELALPTGRASVEAIRAALDAQARKLTHKAHIAQSAARIIEDFSGYAGPLGVRAVRIVQNGRVPVDLDPLTGTVSIDNRFASTPPEKLSALQDLSRRLRILLAAHAGKDSERVIRSLYVRECGLLAFEAHGIAKRLEPIAGFLADQGWSNAGALEAMYDTISTVRRHATGKDRRTRNPSERYIVDARLAMAEVALDSHGSVMIGFGCALPDQKLGMPVESRRAVAGIVSLSVVAEVHELTPHVSFHDLVSMFDASPALAQWISARPDDRAARVAFALRIYDPIELARAVEADGSTVFAAMNDETSNVRMERTLQLFDSQTGLIELLGLERYERFLLKYRPEERRQILGAFLESQRPFGVVEFSWAGVAPRESKRIDEGVLEPQDSEASRRERLLDVHKWLLNALDRMESRSAGNPAVIELRSIVAEAGNRWVAELVQSLVHPSHSKVMERFFSKFPPEPGNVEGLLSRTPDGATIHAALELCAKRRLPWKSVASHAGRLISAAGRETVDSYLRNSAGASGACSAAISSAIDVGDVEQGATLLAFTKASLEELHGTKGRASNTGFLFALRLVRVYHEHSDAQEVARLLIRKELKDPEKCTRFLSLFGVLPAATRKAIAVGLFPTPSELPNLSYWVASTQIRAAILNSAPDEVAEMLDQINRPAAAAVLAGLGNQLASTVLNKMESRVARADLRVRAYYAKAVSGKPLKVKSPLTGIELDNYYVILGLPRKGSEDQVKASYRQLARAFHPDRNVGDEQADRLVRLLNDANSVLSDLEGRRAYDAMIPTNSILYPDRFWLDDVPADLR